MSFRPRCYPCHPCKLHNCTRWRTWITLVVLSQFILVILFLDVIQKREPRAKANTSAPTKQLTAWGSRSLENGNVFLQNRVTGLKEVSHKYAANITRLALNSLKANLTDFIRPEKAKEIYSVSEEKLKNVNVAELKRNLDSLMWNSQGSEQKHPQFMNNHKLLVDNNQAVKLDQDKKQQQEGLKTSDGRNTRQEAGASHVERRNEGHMVVGTPDNTQGRYETRQDVRESERAQPDAEAVRIEGTNSKSTLKEMDDNGVRLSDKSNGIVSEQQNGLFWGDKSGNRLTHAKLSFYHFDARLGTEPYTQYAHSTTDNKPNSKVLTDDRTHTPHMGPRHDDTMKYPLSDVPNNIKGKHDGTIVTDVEYDDISNKKIYSERSANDSSHNTGEKSLVADNNVNHNISFTGNHTPGDKTMGKSLGMTKAGTEAMAGVVSGRNREKAFFGDALSVAKTAAVKPALSVAKAETSKPEELSIKIMTGKIGVKRSDKLSKGDQEKTNTVQRFAPDTEFAMKEALKENDRMKNVPTDAKNSQLPINTQEVGREINSSIKNIANRHALWGGAHKATGLDIASAREDTNHKLGSKMTDAVEQGRVSLDQAVVRGHSSVVNVKVTDPKLPPLSLRPNPGKVTNNTTFGSQQQSPPNPSNVRAPAKPPVMNSSVTSQLSRALNRTIAAHINVRLPGVPGINYERPAQHGKPNNTADNQRVNVSLRQALKMDEPPDIAVPNMFLLPDNISTDNYVFRNHPKRCYIDGVDKLVNDSRYCVCKKGYHGQSCSIPDYIYFSTGSTFMQHVTLRNYSRRVINAIAFNMEYELLEARLHELADVVDVFLILESNYSSHGDEKPLRLWERMCSGFLSEFHEKILYLFLDHFPPAGRQDGWLADRYLRQYIGREGLRHVIGVRPDDLFIYTDADEIPSHDAILFLRLHDNYPEPFGFTLRWSVYGFFWHQFEPTRIWAGCTIAMLRLVFNWDAYDLRSGDYWNRYQSQVAAYVKTGGQVLDWQLGGILTNARSRKHTGWHCSWCLPPSRIQIKLKSAINADFPRWGDFPEKLELNYIQKLIKTGTWFDDVTKLGELSSPELEPYYAPAFLLQHRQNFSHLLDLQSAINL